MPFDRFDRFAMMIDYLMNPAVVSKQQKALTSLSIRSTMYRQLNKKGN